MQGEFATGTLLWLWYDAFVALPFLAAAAYLTYRGTLASSWSSREGLVKRVLAAVGTLLVLMVILDRVGIKTASMHSTVYAMLSIFGAGTAIAVGGMGVLAGRGWRGLVGRDVVAEARDGQEGILGPTQVFTRVRGAAAWLVVRAGGEAGAIIELNENKIIVGGAPTSQVHLDDTSVGPTHALIRADQGTYSLSDLASRSGTWVNGKLEAGEVLREGSKIAVGASELFYTQVPAGGDGAQASSVPMEGVLLVRAGPSMGQSFRVGQGDTVIGRQPGDGGARIDDPAVSQRHAVLRQLPRGARLYDLGSANGTSVDGVELKGVMLKNGDILKFGEAEVQFVHEGDG